MAKYTIEPPPPTNLTARQSAFAQSKGPYALKRAVANAFARFRTAYDADPPRTATLTVLVLLTVAVFLISVIRPGTGRGGPA